METVKTRILLVEDDPSLGPLLQEYLEAKGFETKLADDGKKGADLFFKGSFDLLLLKTLLFSIIFFMVGFVVFKTLQI